jgi:hypothetical protein
LARCLVKKNKVWSGHILRAEREGGAGEGWLSFGFLRYLRATHRVSTAWIRLRNSPTMRRIDCANRCRSKNTIETLRFGGNIFLDDYFSPASPWITLKV